MTHDPAIARLLDAWTPPPLPAGFTDALVARAEAGQQLSPPAPRRHHLRSAWSRAPRTLVGGVAFGLMTATAAAAAGVFGNVGITIPAWQRTVETVTGLELAEPAPVVVRAAPAAPPAAVPAPTLEQIVADGKIESRAELEAATAAIDARRAVNRADRRARTQQRVDAAIAERRARGLPTPSDEQVEAFRARRDARAARREEAVAARRKQEREAIGQRLDDGETIDIEAERARAREQFGERLTPRQRERLERWRARRGGAEVLTEPSAGESEMVEPEPSSQP